jgi:hypothetical protein
VSVSERKNHGLSLEGAPATVSTLEPLLTAVEVGRLLAIPTKRVYDVVGHLAVQLAPHTLRWRLSDITALIEERRRTK